jgi:hypothetical protein
MAALTQARHDLAQKIARNMISKRRQMTSTESGWALHLAQDIGNIRFMHYVMNEIQASNLSPTGDSAGAAFLSSRSKTGIDAKLQKLLTIGHDRIIRTHGRNAFYRLVRRLVPPGEFLRAFLFHPPHQAVAVAAGLITNAGLNQQRLARMTARARNRHLGLDEIESSDDEGEDQDDEDDDDDQDGGEELEDGDDNDDEDGDDEDPPVPALRLPRPGKAPVNRGPGRPRKHPILPENIKEKHQQTKKRGRPTRIQPKQFGG